MGNIASQVQSSHILQPTNLLILAITLFGLHLARRIAQARVAWAHAGNVAGPRTLFGPFSIVTAAFPTVPYLNLPIDLLFKNKYAVHQKYGSDIFVSGHVLSDHIGVWVADAAVVKRMTTNKGEFVKPVEMYIAASLYGPNLVASESDEWKRHRKIAAPSFSERNNRLVYDETTRITTEIFESWSNKGGGETVKVDNALTLTSKLALMVISAAGFGMRSGWEDAEEPPTGHKMTFPTAMSTVLSNFVIRLVFSDTMLNLWQGGRKVATAFKELHVYMREMIEERRQSAAAESDSQTDLFTNLINGTSLEEEEKDGDGLTDEELMGNVFIFLFAGHETTAHSIAFTLALLATHQDIQEKAFRELRSIVPEGEIPTYAHVVKWSYGLACIYESLRLYSPVVAFPKKAAHDTVVATYSADEKNTPITVPIPKGSGIMINVVGLHYNPKYWDEPEVFRPERFLGDYNRDAFMPFAAGPRACIGRRFSEVEAITFLAHLLLNYRFKPTPLNDAETPAQMKERLLRWRQGALTMGPEKVPLTFTRRHK